MQWLLVAMGGACGAMSRVWLGHTIRSAMPSTVLFPWHTFAANIIGCFFIGLVFVLVTEKGQWDPRLGMLLMGGFLGSFTTFSTFSLETLGLLTTGKYMIAITYILASIITGLLAVFAGAQFSRLFLS